MTLRIVAEFTVSAENVDKFLSFIEAGSALVREQESDYVSCYDWFASDPATTRVVVHEAYKDAEHFLLHLSHFGPTIERYLPFFTIDTMLVIGEAPAELISQFRAFAGSNVRHYERTIRVLGADHDGGVTRAR